MDMGTDTAVGKKWTWAWDMYMDMRRRWIWAWAWGRDGCGHRFGHVEEMCVGMGRRWS